GGSAGLFQGFGIGDDGAHGGCHTLLSREFQQVIAGEWRNLPIPLDNGGQSMRFSAKLEGIGLPCIVTAPTPATIYGKPTWGSMSGCRAGYTASGITATCCLWTCATIMA